GATLAEARRGVDAVAALPRARRDKARIRAAVQRMFDVVPPAMEAVTLLSQDAEEVYQRFSGALLNARIAAELREAAGRLGSQFTAALTTGAPLGEDEYAAIHMLRGRIEQLRLLMTLSLSKGNADPYVAAALRAMQARYFGAGLELADGVVAASEAGRPYGMDSGQFAARYVPAMHAILRVRDALLAQSIEDAGRASARARRALLLACGAGAATLLLLAALLLTLRRRVVQPLLRATRALVDIANGRLDRTLPVSRRRDEIGAMQRALALLQRASIEKRQLEEERLRLIEQLKLSADTDHLTGTLNRRAFTAAGKTLARRCHAHRQALSLIVFDIDHFKAVNDEFGHDAGDQVLIHIAQLVRRELCDSDMLARYGGEEFIVMPVGCDLVQARVVAERIRASIAAAPVTLAGAAGLRVTASFGVAAAAIGPLAELDGLFRAADQALYRAKRLGRNRVECALTE
ncbi:diguanylate cyclase, partial [Janthinobacterium sp.]|uniref:GGDEF domain-containing protein n=1 Tax=Janthinobacterium sp. TaxID=1871054 RepID=UPI00293D5147